MALFLPCAFAGALYLTRPPTERLRKALEKKHPSAKFFYHANDVYIFRRVFVIYSTQNDFKCNNYYGIANRWYEVDPHSWRFYRRVEE